MIFTMYLSSRKNSCIKLLYPVTIIADIITLPIQIVTFISFNGIQLILLAIIFNAE